MTQPLSAPDLVCRLGSINTGRRSFCNLLGKETDWNVTSALPAPGINERQIKLSRGKFVGGSSGCNGTICIKGAEQDYDDWGIDGWSGPEFFKYMRKVKPNSHSLLSFQRKKYPDNYKISGRDVSPKALVRDVGRVSRL